MAECPTEFAQSSLLQPRPGTVIRKSASRGYARLTVRAQLQPSRARAALPPCRVRPLWRYSTSVAVQVQASDGRRGPEQGSRPHRPAPNSIKRDVLEESLNPLEIGKL